MFLALQTAISKKIKQKNSQRLTPPSSTQMQYSLFKKASIEKENQRKQQKKELQGKVDE